MGIRGLARPRSTRWACRGFRDNLTRRSVADSAPRRAPNSADDRSRFLKATRAHRRHVCGGDREVAAITGRRAELAERPTFSQAFPTSSSLSAASALFLSPPPPRSLPLQHPSQERISLVSIKADHELTERFGLHTLVIVTTWKKVTTCQCLSAALIGQYETRDPPSRQPLILQLRS